MYRGAPRRVAALVALAWLAWAHALPAQTGVVRARFGTIDITPLLPPSLSITGPTPNSTHTTTSDTLTLAGTARRGASAAPLTQVSYSCISGCMGTGVAEGLEVWAVDQVTAGPAVIFEDQFSGPGTNVDIVTHAPNIGGSWSLWFDTTAAAQHMRLWNGEGAIGPSGSNATAGAKLAARLTLSQALSAAKDYDLEFTPSAISGSSVLWAFIFGGVDTSNYCFVGGLSNSPNPDTVLYSVVGGTPTLIASANADPAQGVAFVLEARGPAFAFKKAGVTVLSAPSATACDNGTIFGVGAGDLTGAGYDVNSTSRFTSLKITDLGATTPGISLALGANVIDVTVTDAAMRTATKRLTVTRVGGGDTVDPAVSILQPTSTGDINVAVAAQTVSGVSSDDVGVTGVTFACPGATPSSGSATGTAAWTFAVSVPNGDTTCTVTAADAAANDAMAQIVFHASLADATPPVVEWVGPVGSGGSYEAVSSLLPTSGSASDNVGVARVDITNSLGGGGSASGSTNWAYSMALLPGSQTLTAVAYDLGGAASTPKSITVTWTPALAWVSPITLPSIITGVAMAGYQLQATGGTGAITYDNNAGGTSLAGYSNCGGLVVSATGLVTGTPSAGAGNTCSPTIRADDAGAGPAITRTFSIAIVAAGSGPHAYFDAMRIRGDYVKGLSMRPQAGHPCLTTTAAWCGDHLYSNQLLRKGQGGYHQSNDPATALTLTYGYESDTDPHKQDAGKLTIAAFVNRTFLVEPMDGSQLTLRVGPDYSALSSILNVNGVELRIGAETMRVVATPCNITTGPTTNCAYNKTTGIITLQSRATLGTVATTHSIGDAVARSNNSNLNQWWLPLGTADGNTYLTVFDFYLTDSWVGTGLTNLKWMNHRSTSIWFEPNIVFGAGVSGCSGTPDGYNAAVHAGWLKTRTYNGTVGVNNVGAPANWLDSNGDTLGPGWYIGGNDSPCPQVTEFIFAPNRWNRMWIRYDQRANDYDPVSVWIADEVNGPVQILDDALLSIGQSLLASEQRIVDLNFQSSTSSDRYFRNASCVPLTLTNCELVTYYRNVSFHVSAGPASSGTLSDAAMAAILVKPLP